jgi:drug/metabolite transporter superfamily protein YnfA
LVAAMQPDVSFGRLLAAGPLAWGIFVDGMNPTIWDGDGSTCGCVGNGGC